MPHTSHTSLVLPGQDTLLASWSALAELSPGARLLRSSATVAAVFPAWSPLNNAILLAGADGASVAIAHLSSVYAEEGVGAWALWLPTRRTDLDAPDEVRELDGFKRDTTTLVMRTALPEELPPHDRVVRTSIAAATRAAGDGPVPAAHLPKPDWLPGLDGWVMVHDELAVAGAWSFLHGTDCGIYAVGTLPDWRRRGLARALMLHVMGDAKRRGARTATLQSTRMGRPLYASLGFEPVGRYEEWISR